MSNFAEDVYESLLGMSVLVEMMSSKQQYIGLLYLFEDSIRLP